MATLSLVDYSSIQKELATFIYKDDGSLNDLSTLEVHKFPLPSITMHNANILGILRAENLYVNFTPLSIFKLKPQAKSFTIEGPGYSLEITAKYENGQYSYGKAHLVIKSLSKILANYPSLSRSLASLGAQEEVAVNFDIVLTNQYITLTNITMQSENLEGGGEITIALDKNLPSKVKLALDKVNIGAEKFSQVSIIATKTTTLGSPDNNAITISAKIDSGGVFDLAGHITENAYRPMFSGHINFKHEDINKAAQNLGLSDIDKDKAEKVPGTLSSDITMTEMEWAVQNAECEIASLLANGSGSIRFIGDTPRVALDLNLLNFDSSKEYPFLSSEIRYWSSLSQDMKDPKYISKFAPLMKLGYIGDFNLAFVNPIIIDTKIDNLSISAALSTGRVKVESIEYKDGNSHIKASAELGVTSVKPQFSLSISEAVLDMEIPSVNSALRSQKAIDFTKLDIALDIASLKFLQHPLLGEIKAKVTNNNGILVVEKFTSTSPAGSFNLSGNVTIADPITVNFAYICDMLDAQSLTGFLPSGIKAKGFINTSGTLSTYGLSAEDFLYNFYSKSNFITSKLEIDGLGIDDLVTKLNDMRYDPTNLEQDITLAIDSGSTDISEASGNYEILQGIMSFKDVVLHSNLVSTSLAVAYNIYNQDYDLSSVLSFYFKVKENNKLPTTLGINLERHGQNLEKTIDTKAIFDSFVTRFKK